MNRDRETSLIRPGDWIKSGRGRVMLRGLVIDRGLEETGQELYDWSRVSIVSNGYVRVFDEMGDPVIRGYRALKHRFVHDSQTRVASAER